MRFLYFALILVTISCARRPGNVSKGAADYDPAAEVVFSGVVEKVTLHSHDGPPTVHLVVATGGRELTFHIAPPSFLKRNGFSFEAGDQVEIVACPQKDEPHYHAGRVTKGSRTLVLRDSLGVPLWTK